MAILKDIEISNNIMIRPKAINIFNYVWFTNIGKKYKTVEILIEMKKVYWWRDTLCFPANMGDWLIYECCERYAATKISEKDIEDYENYLESIEKWGCE